MIRVTGDLIRSQLVGNAHIDVTNQLANPSNLNSSDMAKQIYDAAARYSLSIKTINFSVESDQGVAKTLAGVEADGSYPAVKATVGSLLDSDPALALLLLSVHRTSSLDQSLRTKFVVARITRQSDAK